MRLIGPGGTAAAKLSRALFYPVVILALSGPAHALSSACALVDSGTYDLVNSGSIILPMGSGYDPGETVTFVVSTNVATTTFRIMIDGSDVQTISTSPTPVTATQSMTSASEALSIGFQGTGGRRLTMTARCTVPGASQIYDLRVTKSFLLSRINGLLLNSPASTSILYRGLGPQAAPIAAAASSNGTSVGTVTGHGASRFDDDTSTIGSEQMQFRSSFSAMRQTARDAQMQRDRMALGAGEGGTVPLAFAGSSTWDVWVEGRYSGFDDDAGNLGRDGHVGLLFLGSDYRITPDVIVGGLVQWDRSKDAADAIASEVSGTGWMLGPYVSARVHENIYVDLRAAWGTSWNDLNVGATNASFDTTRWLVKGTVSGNWTWDAWRVTPSAELAYVTENQDSFTNSAGVFVPGQDVSLGRLQFGPEVGYRFAHSSQLMVEPFAAIKGVWDFDNPNVQIIDGFVVGPGDFWGRLEGGLNVLATDGTVVRGLASWDGVGSDDYSGFTLQGIANIPLN